METGFPGLSRGQKSFICSPSLNFRLSTADTYGKQRKQAGICSGLQNTDLDSIMKRKPAVYAFTAALCMKLITYGKKEHSEKQ